MMAKEERISPTRTDLKAKIDRIETMKDEMTGIPCHTQSEAATAGVEAKTRGVEASIRGAEAEAQEMIGTREGILGPETGTMTTTAVIATGKRRNRRTARRIRSKKKTVVRTIETVTVTHETAGMTAEMTEEMTAETEIAGIETGMTEIDREKETEEDRCARTSVTAKVGRGDENVSDSDLFKSLSYAI